jgi:hypothetical protein
MKTQYYVREVWMNKISIVVEPIPGSGFARVLTRSNEEPHTDADWVRPVDARLLEATHLPAEHQMPTAVALTWLFDEWDVVRVVISDARDGWRADIDLIVNNEAFSGRGHAATPADAVRAAKLDAYNKAAR